MTHTIYLPSKELMNNSLELRDNYNEFVRKVKVSQQSPEDYRILLSNTYLCGRGIEVGAFHAPNYLPEGCQADYVDKVDIETLKRWMPETSELYCVFPNIIDDGEKLSKINGDSYDFLIANHMLEHTENVFQTIENHMRVVKDGGYLFYALPDKRYTFDIDRELTTYEHLKDEYFNGVMKNRVEHYREFGTKVSKIKDETELNNYVDRHIKENRDIHFHVWTYETFLEHISKWIIEAGLNIEIVEHVQNGIEFIIILKKMTNLEIAEKLIIKEDLKKAKEILNNLLKSDENKLEALNNLVVIAIMEKQYIEAEKILKTILAKDNNDEIAIENYQYLKEIMKNDE